MTDEMNEFDKLEQSEAMSQPEEVPEEVQASNEPKLQNSQGQEYDYNNAPDVARAPPRVLMTGMIVKIEEAKLLLPTERDKVQTAMTNKDVKYKRCRFIVKYSWEGQMEYYSGVSCFINKDGTLTHPNINPQGETQATQLLRKVAEYLNVTVHEVSLKQFMSFLNSGPVCEMGMLEAKNPTDNSIVNKNFPFRFVDPSTQLSTELPKSPKEALDRQKASQQQAAPQQ